MNEAYAAITFLSYADLEAGIRFYQTTLGLELVEDQGWAKVYRLCDGGYVGIVQSKQPLAETGRRRRGPVDHGPGCGCLVRSSEGL